MKSLKIVSFQRNGTSGNGFYTATFTAEKEPFMATFETTGHILWKTTCRVHQLTDLAEKWRGDDFAVAIQKRISIAMAKHKVDSIYDLIGRTI